MLLVLWWTEAGVATVVVGLRFYTRYSMRAILIEDWLMLLALVRCHHTKHNNNGETLPIRTGETTATSLRRSSFIANILFFSFFSTRP